MAAHIKLAEIPIAALAAVGFYLHSVPILFVTLGLFGIVAALFGPVKYGILPEKLEMAELPAGNALVEGATFVAILVGTIAGGIAVTASEQRRDGGGLDCCVRDCVVAVRARDPVGRTGGAEPADHAQPLDVDGDAAARAQRPTARLWAGAHIASWFWLMGSSRWRCCRPWSRTTSAAPRAW